MIHRQAGGAAIYVLGGALLSLLLVGALGLAETAAATVVKTRATRALEAALQSAARQDLTDHTTTERTFQRILAANLGEVAHTADLIILADGGYDPLTEERFRRPTLSARLEVPHRLAYLGHWLPDVRLTLNRTWHPAPVQDEKRKPPN